jgi:hypothetical protein
MIVIYCSLIITYFKPVFLSKENKCMIDEFRINKKQYPVKRIGKNSFTSSKFF